MRTKIDVQAIFFQDSNSTIVKLSETQNSCQQTKTHHQQRHVMWVNAYCG